MPYENEKAPTKITSSEKITSETNGSADELFNPLDKKLRVYSRRNTTSAFPDLINLKTGDVPSVGTPCVQMRSTPDIGEDISKIL